MGIRYDRERRQATNGPVIFFSDASSLAAFSEEIEGAIISGLSFYSYRLPGTSMISFGSSEGFIEGVGLPGFVIGFFNPDFPCITIPYRGCKRNGNSGSLYHMPEISTSYAEYINEVKEFKSVIDGDQHKKIVAARVVMRNNKPDLGQTFFDLCNRFPHNYIFCFSTPATGCWIGASPELLLEGKNRSITSMALAGTRPISGNLTWDEKNIGEQRIVTDYIMSEFCNHGLYPEEAPSTIKRSGDIEHLCTLITSEKPSIDFDLSSFLHSFSPTPALCGYPKSLAMDAISKFEKFDRGCYGGFCGPFHSQNDFLFNVILRCASVSERNYCIYIGGGITSKSVPEEEWKETESKIIFMD